MNDSNAPKMPEKARVWILLVDTKCRKQVEIMLDDLIYTRDLEPSNVAELFQRMCKAAVKFEQWLRERQLNRPKLSDRRVRALRQWNQVILLDPAGFRCYLEYLASVAHLCPADRERLRNGKGGVVDGHR